MNELRFDMDDRSEWRSGYGPAPLSPAGLERRAAMRALLEREVSRRRARRILARRGIAAALVSIGIVVLAERLAPWKEAPVAVIETLPSPAPVAPPIEERLLSVRLEIVRAKPDLSERWRVRGKPGDVKVLSDDDLLRELAAADMPSGLIRVPEGYILTADLTRPARRG